QLLEMQRALLAQLMSDGVAQRLLDSEGKADSAGPAATRAMRLAELYARLDADVWHELDAPAGEIAGPRRQLQREHLNRLVVLLSRPSATGRADALALLRSQAQGLLTRLHKASERRELSAEARAHLQDCRDILREVLTARLLRPVA
ncbi:MAG: hypothetical protein ABI574_18845, partial [Burkholderiales bacterium]